MQLIDLRPKRVGADLRGVCQLGSNVNQIPDGAILTEDGLFYLITEDELNYIQQETEA